MSDGTDALRLTSVHASRRRVGGGARNTCRERAWDAVGLARLLATGAEGGEGLYV